MEDKKHFPKFAPNQNGVIEYTSYIDTLSLQPISQDIQDSFRKIFNSEVHPYIKRGLYFSQRNFEELITAYSQQKPLFILSELKPNGQTSLDISEVFHYQFIKWFQDLTNCFVVIMIGDDEEIAEKKFSAVQIGKNAKEKLKSILSLDLNQSRTFAFMNQEYRTRNNAYESLVSEFKMKISYARLIELFDFNDEVLISKLDYPCYISCAISPQIYQGLIDKEAHCLIPTQVCNVNRYELCTEANSHMGINKPTLLVGKIVPPLTGTTGKECFTDAEHTLLLSDDEKTISKKVMKQSLSGSRGNGSLEDHQKLGGNADVDISIQYFEYLELDDGKFNEVKAKFSKGELSCGSVKQTLVNAINALFSKLRQKQSTITDEMISKLFDIKK